MFSKFNPVFCKNTNDLEKCYNCKRNRCPSLSNIIYGYFINPINKFFGVVKNGFKKCKSENGKCSFRMYNMCSVSKKINKNCK